MIAMKYEFLFDLMMDTVDNAAVSKHGALKWDQELFMIDKNIHSPLWSVTNGNKKETNSQNCCKPPTITSPSQTNAAGSEHHIVPSRSK